MQSYFVRYVIKFLVHKWALVFFEPYWGNCVGAARRRHRAHLFTQQSSPLFTEFLPSDNL
jgi:hypothetical protein